MEELEGLERDVKERDSRLTQEKEEKTRWENKKKFEKKNRRRMKVSPELSYQSLLSRNFK